MSMNIHGSFRCNRYVMPIDVIELIKEDKLISLWWESSSYWKYDQESDEVFFELENVYIVKGDDTENYSPNIKGMELNEIVFYDPDESKEEGRVSDLHLYAREWDHEIFGYEMLLEIHEENPDKFLEITRS